MADGPGRARCAAESAPKWLLSRMRPGESGADVPPDLRVDNGHERALLCGTTGTFFFWVPAGSRSFGVRVSGEGVGEAVRAALVDRSGQIVEQVDNVAATHQFEVDLPKPSAGEAWSLVLSKPTRIPMEDQHIDLRGIPPLLAGSKEGLLRPE